MLSDNPHAGIYKAQTSRTLDTGGGNPGCNQGGIAVVAREKSYAMTMNSYVQVEEEKTPALLSRDYKDPTAVNSGYTVRRLTPPRVRPITGFPGLVVLRLGYPGTDRRGYRVLDGGLGDTPANL